MRVNWNYIKFSFLLIMLVFLFAFASERNKTRTITDIQVSFLGDNNLFITEEAVNKLLIQNNDSLTTVLKETLDLNGLETALRSNPMIKTAEVYLTVNGEVKAEIEQRQPIARVSTNASYYIDEDGLFMPLSENRSARVPLVTGDIVKNDLGNVYKIANRIQNDEFLKMHIIEIIQHSDKTISLRTRELDLEIFFGHLDFLDKKVSNLKAFYQKAKKDKTLNNYKTVNLQFENQVVCTKK
ncbi:MAG: hypothetical protein HKN00_13970 [Flavobacteriaceae bacterium]|nr:hypothetical protein [Bacteroidia bacterium]MBT8288006.1 hypothetical protein [Bacteroidia bacterium]NNF76287.1 hypothetical protein [Flavobacteriaceae bacterium]NNK73323.1 hypothetical protein [Flavobacteriaceae bacterium]